MLEVRASRLLPMVVFMAAASACEIGNETSITLPPFGGPGSPAGRTLPDTLWVFGDVTLPADFLGHVAIGADGVTLDGAGRKILGGGRGFGINLQGHRDVKLRDLTVDGFQQGVWAVQSHDLVLEGVVASGNAWNGIVIRESMGVRVVGSHASGNGNSGIILETTGGWEVTGVSAEDNGHNGFVFQGAWNGVARDNRARGNAHVGMGLWSGSNGNMLERNEALNNGFSGFLVQASASNHLEENHAGGNAEGFLARRGAALNVFRKNAGHGNRIVDALDDRTGTPWNQWSNNEFGTWSPDDLR